jgi:AcrR family transcriptional regulator
VRAATSLADVAAEAGITRVILYRHFDSKAGMYRAVLDRACTRLASTVGTGDYGEDAVAVLVRAAAADPDGFRLLFRHAAREPEFRDQADALTAASAEVARRDLAGQIPAGPWLDWAARLVPRRRDRSRDRLARRRAARTRPGRRAHRPGHPGCHPSSQVDRAGTGQSQPSRSPPPGS